MTDSLLFINVSGSTPILSQPTYNASVSNESKMGSYVAKVEEDAGLRAFEAWYKPIHGYLAAFVCVVGVIANILNIIVLTRKNMVSATNIILTGLAITDGLTMAAYFPYALHQYVIFGSKVTIEKNTEDSARFQLGFAIFSVIVHSISIWLTVTLAVFRYVFIKFPRRGAKYCNVQRAKLAVIIVAVVVTIVCIPNSINYEIRSNLVSKVIPDSDEDPNATIWWVDIKQNTDADRVLEKFNFWVQAILVKLVPCVLLTIFSVLLVRTMQGAENRRKKLLAMNNSVTDGETQPIGNGSKRSKRSIRTTRMLLSVVILFLITETPNGVLNLLSGLIEGFFHNVYMPLGDVMDIFALINNGINFVLYCTMSKQFRDTFFVVFCQCFPKLSDRRRLTNVTTIGTTRDSEV